MIIHSKFKDYYDIGLRYGVDTTLHWNRQSEIVDSENRLYYNHSLFSLDYDYMKSIYFYKFSIIVCGVKYRGIKCTTNDFSNTYEYFYDFDSLDRFIKGIGKKCYKAFCNTIKTYDNKTLYQVFSNTKNFFYTENNYIRECEQYDTCIIVRTYEGLEINSCLKDYQFYKVWDSFTCYQNIVAFMTNHILIKEKEVNAIPDKYKIKAHGFDKWSFRKQGNMQK